MGRDNNVYRKVKKAILDNPRKEGWTSTDLGNLVQVKGSTLRYICDQLVDQGYLLKKNLEHVKHGDCRVKYFIPPTDEEDIFGVGMANKIDVHNIFRRPHCGGRG